MWQDPVIPPPLWIAPTPNGQTSIIVMRPRANDSPKCWGEDIIVGLGLVGAPIRMPTNNRSWMLQNLDEESLRDYSWINRVLIRCRDNAQPKNIRIPGTGGPLQDPMLPIWIINQTFRNMRSTTEWPNKSPGISNEEFNTCDANRGRHNTAVENVGARHVLRD